VAVPETLDPFDLERGRRHQEAMAELRATCPVARLGSGMYVVSRYDDVRRLARRAGLTGGIRARAG